MNTPENTGEKYNMKTHMKLSKLNENEAVIRMLLIMIAGKAWDSKRVNMA